jgi:hypothetical protein
MQGTLTWQIPGQCRFSWSCDILDERLLMIPKCSIMWQIPGQKRNGRRLRGILSRSWRTGHAVSHTSTEFVAKPSNKSQWLPTHGTFREPKKQEFCGLLSNQVSVSNADNITQSTRFSPASCNELTDGTLQRFVIPTSWGFLILLLQILGFEIVQRIPPGFSRFSWSVGIFGD